MKAHAVRMRSVGILGGLAVALAMALTPVATAARSSGGGASTPTWWAKYERLLHHPAAPLTSTATLSVGPDVDVHSPPAIPGGHRSRPRAAARRRGCACAGDAR